MAAFLYQKDSSKSPQFAIGQSDFARIIESSSLFIDKSLGIQSIIDSHDGVLLFPRPRRFGKTLFLSMLKYFFEESEPSRRHLFEPLQIWQAGGEYQQHQGQYPVIFLSFKDVKNPNFALALSKIRTVIAECYRYHDYLLESPALSQTEKEKFKTLLDETAHQATLEESLRTLSRWLEAHHQQKVVLLLDEYDSPIHASYAHGYYDEMMNFMRGLLSGAFKDNNHLYKAVITGILRVARESLFSGLNNLRVFSILSEQYSEFFGFTQEEVDLALERFNLIAKRDDVRHWYNGYRFGKTEIYNPWSIINCLAEGGRCIPYWVNTADNVLVRDMLAKAQSLVKNQLESLLKSEYIQAPIAEGLIFNTLKLDVDALYSFLLFTGYLTATDTVLEENGNRFVATLRLPNEEIRRLYFDFLRQWMTDTIEMDQYQALLEALTLGNIEEFEYLLQRFVIASISYFDADDAPEKFYHGLVLGILAGLSQTHDVKSNREAGYGRADVLIVPKDRSQLGIIIEFKRCRKREDLEPFAKEALAQIERRQYQQELQSLGISKTLALGISFFGKEMCLRAETP